MASFVLTIPNIPTSVDRPGIQVAQILREVAATVEQQAPIQSSFTHKERAGQTNATKATWTWS